MLRRSRAPLLVLASLAMSGCPGTTPSTPVPPPGVAPTASAARPAPAPAPLPSPGAPPQAPATPSALAAEQRALATKVVAAHSAGVLGDVDRTVLERLLLPADARANALQTDAELVRDLAQRARDGKIAPDEYTAYRALLSASSSNDLRRSAAQALLSPRDAATGSVHRLAIADLLLRRAEGRIDGPMSEVATAARELTPRLEQERDAAVHELEELVKKPAGPDAAKQVRAITVRRAAADAELVRVPALLEFLAQTKFAPEGGVELPEKP